MLDALFIISYLRKRHNSRICLDQTYPDIEHNDFKENANWTAFYGDVQEAKPVNAPKPLGKGVDLRMFVDSDHAGDKTSRCSCTGYLIFLNMALISWHTKMQATVEGAVFGVDFFAMK